MKNLKEFCKNRDFLVCVDSDGCAMDTMNIKHKTCFGPCMVEEWGLTEWRNDILKRWDEINLYTSTRGINRFKALAMILEEISGKYTAVDGVKEFSEWAENAPELSNAAVRQKALESGKTVFQKALRWSTAVNEKINGLSSEDKKAFPGVREALAYAHEAADLAIVSSANPDAVQKEWEENGLLSFADVVCAQDSGSKSDVLGMLCKKGYDRKHILMCGDAPGDRAAAEKNEVLFYPILVRKEAESWKMFSEAVRRLKDGTYEGRYQAERTEAFLQNLRG